MNRHVAFASIAGLVLAETAAASVISDIQNLPSGTVGVVANNNPVVTAVLSRPGFLNGRTYTSWNFLIDDGSGGLAVYASSSVMTGLGYTPTVGDVISITGTYTLYHQIPEITTPTAITKIASGQSVPAPTVLTVAQANQNPLPKAYVARLIEIHDATIQNFPGTFQSTDGPDGVSLTDSSGSMQFWYWPSSYSVSSQNFFGTTPPAGPVDLTGVLSVYSTRAEFHPISLVPEPAVISMVLAAGLPLLRRRRHAVTA